MSDPYNSLAYVRESAPLALAYATGNCLPCPGPEPTCCWYHGVWQYFRLLDLVATPWKQEEFFRAAFRKLAGSGDHRRVLICGSSDYAMLALLLSSYRDEGVEPLVTVVDRCTTPLFLNRWFGERHGASVATLACDALSYNIEEPYDLICTHSFLGYFAPEQRPALIGGWGRLLRPGGKVVTVQRIRDGAQGHTTFSAEQTARFLEKVRLACLNCPEDLGIPPAELLRRAEIYCSGYESYPVTSLSQLLGFFADQGFRMESLSEEGEGAVADGGPATPGQGGRVQLVLSKGDR